MKSLKPSMRENRRYLLISNPDYKDVEKSILDFVGVLGLAKSGLTLIKKEKNSIIVSITRESLNPVRASFAVWPKSIKIVKVSGTLKGLNRK